MRRTTPGVLAALLAAFSGSGCEPRWDGVVEEYPVTAAEPTLQDELTKDDEETPTHLCTDLVDERCYQGFFGCEGEFFDVEAFDDEFACSTQLRGARCEFVDSDAPVAFDWERAADCLDDVFSAEGCEELSEMFDECRDGFWEEIRCERTVREGRVTLTLPEEGDRFGNWGSYVAVCVEVEGPPQRIVGLRTSEAGNPELDTVLVLYSPDREAIEMNDDPEESEVRFAQLTVSTFDGDGVYLVVVAGYDGDDFGEVVLEVARQGQGQGPPPPPPPDR